jgi:anti-sigma B factor antagonist
VSLTLAGHARLSRCLPGLVASTSIEGTATVIALRGEADIATLPVLVDMLARVVADDLGAVVINLAPTTFIDTATVRILDRARQLLSDRDRELTFRSPSRLAARVLTCFGLSHLVEPGRSGPAMTAGEQDERS